MAWHGSFETGKGSFTGSCKSWTTDKPEVTGLASDFLLKHMLDQGKMSCYNKLVVFCIEVPQDIVRYLMARMFELPKNNTKHVTLSYDEHNLLLKNLDNNKY